MSTRRPIVDLLPWARDLVGTAGEFTQSHFRSDLDIATKGDGTPVTVADQGAERLMREAITAEFPDDAIIGEEYGETHANSGRQWIIDPIDGTKAFTKGVPLYSNLLAVLDDGVPVLGIVNLPAVGEMLWATTGGGAFCNGETCRVSEQPRLDGSYAMTSGVTGWATDGLHRLRDRGVIMRTWGDAYGYALVATGRAEAMVDPIVSIWDIAPIGVLITEAGGRFTCLDGVERIDGGHGLGTNGLIHDELLAELAAQGTPSGESL
ncbi:MAG: inositol monophosphatase family protein [Actinomycetota bacterium]